MKNKENLFSDAPYFAIIVLLGIISGTIGVLFHLSVDWLFESRRLVLAGFDVSTQIVVSMAFSALLALAAFLLVRYYAPEAAGSGVQEIEGAMEDLRPLRWKHILPVKFVGGFLSLGSGMTLGREGPTIHMGAAVGQALSEWFKLRTLDRKGLLAAGAAAGLAAAFNAPLAAVLFVIEETRSQFPYHLKTYMGVIFASIISATITEHIGGVGPELSIPEVSLPLAILPIFLVLGPVLGMLGVWLNRSIIFALDQFDRLPDKWHHYNAPIVGAVAGLLIVIFPAATGGGEILVHRIVLDHPGTSALLALFAIRYVMTLVSYSSGVPGGIFAPLLAVASCAGLVVGALLHLAGWNIEHLAVGCAIASMGGLFAGSIRAPLVGVVLVLELTGAYELMLPVLITCSTANLMAHKMGGRPIYEELLERTLRKEHQPVPDKQEQLPVELGPDEDK
ncbi:MAG: H(+)/Cl(-) exchange transporter ClcA [Stappiaceae bacterium]